MQTAPASRCLSRPRHAAKRALQVQFHAAALEWCALRVPQNNIKNVKYRIVRLMRMLIEVRWATHCSSMTPEHRGETPPVMRAPPALLLNGMPALRQKCACEGVQHAGGGARRGVHACMLICIAGSMQACAPDPGICMHAALCVHAAGVPRDRPV